MKRFALFFFSAIFFLNTLLLSSCANNSKVGNVLVCGFSDSLPEMNIELEYDKWSTGTYIDAEQPKNITCKAGNFEFSGDYSDSRLIFGTCEKSHRYFDSNKNAFEINDEGVLTAFFWGAGEKTNEVKNQEECKSIAIEFVKNVLGSSLDDYKETVLFDEKRQLYTFEFIKCTKDIETTECITIIVQETGQIYSYRATMYGKIHEDDVPDFDIDSIQNTVLFRLDNLTKDIRDKFDDIEYNDFQYSISMSLDKKYVMLCTVNIECSKKTGENIANTSEKLQFVIPLE